MEARAHKTPEAIDTKERLIEAGLHVFCERGYTGASIREICARAGANPAAINYHFGDKERFYAEVLVTCHQRAVARRHMPTLADDPGHPEKLLRAWVRWFLELLLVDAESSPLGKMMAREMVQPTSAFDDLIRRSILPTFKALGEIVEALTAGVPRRRTLMATQSVLGQCLLYKHAKPAFERLRRLAELGELPEPGPGELTHDLNALAHHVAEFSLAGLAQLRAAHDGDPA